MTINHLRRRHHLLLRRLFPLLTLRMILNGRSDRDQAPQAHLQSCWRSTVSLMSSVIGLDRRSSSSLSTATKQTRNGDKLHEHYWPQVRTSTPR